MEKVAVQSTEAAIYLKRSKKGLKLGLVKKDCHRPIKSYMYTNIECCLNL